MDYDQNIHAPYRTVRIGLLQLTATSYVVLGLIEAAGESTPYDLKQGVAQTIGNFWSIPHSQLYAEPKRLARGGLLAERRERGGRRRIIYRLTAEGREALTAWRREGEAAMPELRDPSLLKLFLGAEPERVAEAQAEAHRQRLAGYEALSAADDGSAPRGPWLALRAGIRHEREWVDYWETIARGEEPAV